MNALWPVSSVIFLNFSVKSVFCKILHLYKQILKSLGFMDKNNAKNEVLWCMLVFLSEKRLIFRFKLA